MTVVTDEQLARLYLAANKSNSLLSAALRAKPRDKELIQKLRQEARTLNRGYDAARRQFKKQQKARRRAQWRTTLIQFYLDHKETISQTS